MDDSFYERLRNSDDSVLSEIDSMYRDWFIGALRRKFQGLALEDLDDCFNAALEALWEYRRKLRGRRKLSRILFTFARRRAIDCWRREETVPNTVHLEDWSAVESQVTTLEGNGVTSEDPDLRRLIENTLKALDSLDQRYATIIRMDAAGAGIATSKDIAYLTGIPLEQVSVYRSRARSAMEKKLRDLGVLPPEEKAKKTQT